MKIKMLLLATVVAEPMWGLRVQAVQVQEGQVQVVVAVEQLLTHTFLEREE